MALLNEKYSGNDKLDEKIHQWLEWDKNEKTHTEIKTLINNKDWNTLEKRLCNRLTFGTAGLRGIMQAGFNAMNDLVVIQTAQGLCKYILECFPDKKYMGIILGYDGRHNSKRFAELSACVFINEGIPVYLYSKMVATPFIPFAIKELKCLAGVMVTASHNPKDDNGYKVYWDNGAQIISPHDKNIQKLILENLCPLETSWNLELLESPLLRDPYTDMIKLYMEKLTAYIPKKFLNINEKSDINFVYTAMHGVGYPFIEMAFKSVNLKSVIPVIEQRDPNPDFPTVKFPNPEEGKSALNLSIKLADEKGITIIIANDPDADRLACAEKNSETGQWKVFSGNELGALLGWWALHSYCEMNPSVGLSDCYMLASTVSSQILKSMAQIEGFNFIETLTGFKWMGNKAVQLLNSNKKVLYAFEESIGYMFSTIVLDKDGISAATHLATLCCYLKEIENITLTEKLNRLYEEYGYHCTNNSYYLCYEPEKIKKIFERIRNWNGQNQCYCPSICNAKYTITSIRDLTTGVDTNQPNGKAVLPSSPNSQMITFTFDNGVVMTLRTSGTEPKIKYYAEMCAKPEEKDWEQLRVTLKEIIDGVIDEFLQPELNGLIPKED